MRVRVLKHQEGERTWFSLEERFCFMIWFKVFDYGEGNRYEITFKSKEEAEKFAYSRYNKSTIRTTVASVMDI